MMWKIEQFDKDTGEKRIKIRYGESESGLKQSLRAVKEDLWIYTFKLYRSDIDWKQDNSD